MERSENLLETKSGQYWTMNIIGSMHIIRYWIAIIPSEYLIEITDTSMFLLFGGLMILDIIFGLVIFVYRTNLMQNKKKWVLIPSTAVVVLLLLGIFPGIYFQPLLLLSIILISTCIPELVLLIYFGQRWMKHDWVDEES